MQNRISTAVVMANGVATTYRRWGSGRTVVLLGASEAIARALGEAFRVIVPDVPLHFSDGGAVGWLCGVWDGLGIAEAAIVVAPPWRDAASQFAQEAPDCVKGVIVANGATPNLLELRTAVERAFS